MLLIDVIGLGAINYDHFFIVDKIIIDGEEPIEESSVHPGGSAANTIFGLAKLGIKCGFIGAVGSDHEGKNYIRDFNLADIDTTGIVIKKNFCTGYTICISDKHNKRSIYVYPGANDAVSINDIDIYYVNLAKIFHITSFVNDQQFKLQAKLVENLKENTKISFSPGMLYARKGLDSLSPILQKTHILFATRKEIETMTNKEFPSGVQNCLQLGCKYVVVTMGKGYLKKGKHIICHIFSADNVYEISMPKQTIKTYTESTGAGDSFAAGFIYGFIKGKDIAECAKIGHIAAMFTVQSIGSRLGLPDLKSLGEHYTEFTGMSLL